MERMPENDTRSRVINIKERIKDSIDIKQTHRRGNFNPFNLRLIGGAGNSGLYRPVYLKVCIF